jgi:MFS family permease
VEASRAEGFGPRFWALIFSTFFGFLGIGTVLPVLAPHVRHDLGGSDRTVGFLIGIFYFVALASRVFSGKLADQKGRRIAFITGLSCCATAGFIFTLPLGIPGAFLARTFQGFGEACLYTAAAAWAVELAGIQKSAQALGFLSSGIWGGISAGPVVGQWLGTFERAAWMQMVAALAGIAVLWKVDENYCAEHSRSRTSFFQPSLIAPGLAVGFANVQFPVVAGFLVLHLASHGNSGPAAFSAYATVILFSRFFLGSLPDRLPPYITFYMGLAAMTVALVILASGPPPAIAVTAAGLLGFGFSFPWSSIASTVMRRLPSNQRGSAVGFLSMFYDLFVGMSSFAAGLVSARWGYSAAFLMAAAAILGSAVFGAQVFFRNQEESSRAVNTNAA